MDRIENAKMLLQRVGKINLGFYPTPLQRLDRISNEYEINLYAKREDFSGMTLFGGNKIRKLEYLLNDAKIKAVIQCLPTVQPSPTMQWKPPQPCENVE